jgi:hypothetical protein
MIHLAQPHQFATGGFWINLPRICRGAPSARLLTEKCRSPAVGFTSASPRLTSLTRQTPICHLCFLAFREYNIPQPDDEAGCHAFDARL